MTFSNYQDDFEQDDFEPDNFQDDFEPEKKQEKKPREIKAPYPEKERNIFGVPQSTPTHMAAELGEVGKGALSSLTFGASEQLSPKQLYGPLSYLLPEDWTKDSKVFQSEEKFLREDENVPGFAAGQLLGSLPFLEGAGVPIVNSYKAAAKKFPLFPKISQAVAEMTGWGTTGAIEAGAKDLAKGEYPNPDHMIEHAATYAALDGGLKILGGAFNFTKELFRKAALENEPIYSLVERIVDYLDGKKITDPKEMAERAIQWLNPENAKSQAEKPIGSALEAISPKEAANKGFRVTQSGNLGESAVEKEVSEFAPRYEDKKQFGESVQSGLEETFTKEKKVYDDLYKQSDKAVSQAVLTPRESASKVADAVMNIQKFETKPAGYEKFEKDAVKFLNDAGYTIQKDLSTGKISEIIAPPEGTSTLSAKEAVELSRRISEFVDYEAVEPSIKKVWGAVAKSLKEESKVAIGKVSDVGLKTFEKAERAYESTARKFGKDAVKSARYTELPSDIAKSITHPDKLSHLKEVLSPEKFKAVEREVMEALNESTDPAKLFREIKNQLTPEGRALGEKIVRQKELDQAITKAGNIKDVLKNPNMRKAIEERGGKGTIEFLEKMPEMQKKMELFDKIVTNNPEKFKKSIGTFFETRKQSFKRQPTKVEKGVGETFEKFKEGKVYKSPVEGKPPIPRESAYGTSRLEKIQKSRHPIREFFLSTLEDVGLSEKKANVILSAVFGVPKVGADVFTKIWWNPRLRRSFSAMANKSSRDPLTFYAAVEQFAQDVAEEESHSNAR